MRVAIGLMVLMTAAAFPAGGDTVYLLGGRKVIGTVAKKDGKVIVTDDDGNSQTFDENIVMYIAEQDLPGQSTKVDPRSGTNPTQPVRPRPIRPTKVLLDKSLKPDFVVDDKRFTLNQAVRPESGAFLLMRSAATPGGTDPADSQIRKWQIMSKDRQRFSGQSWLDPDDFIRIRKKVVAEFEAAQDLYRQIRRDHSRRYSQTSARNVPDPNFAPAYQRMKRTALLWPDPNIRDFLTGVACLKAEQYTQAEMHFRRAARELDLVAAFHQGLGFAAMGAKKPLEALKHFTRTLELEPESRYAAELLRWALNEVPGHQFQNPQYVAARDFLKTFPKDSRPIKPPSNRNERITWLLPGRVERVADDQMPLPFYDRIDVFQALAVPVEKQKLLVDAETVERAHAVYVRIAPEVYLPAEARRRRRLRADDQPFPDLAGLDVENVEFTPLKFDDQVSFQVGDELALARLSFHASMQTVPNLQGLRVTELDAQGQPRIDLQAQPGDAASPVIASDGRLAGFVSARNQVMAEAGGPHRFWGLKDIEPMLKLYGRSSYSSYNRTNRTGLEAIKTDRKYFVVYGLFGERFVERSP